MNTHNQPKATRTAQSLAFAIAISAAASVLGSSPVLAQDVPASQAPDAQGQGRMEDSQPLTGTLPDAWDTSWDTGTYDRLHYVVGTVASFSPYRLLVARPSGETTQIDLNKGTVIRPSGLELSPGEHVAVIGYWSKGTFIGNRVVLRRA